MAGLFGRGREPQSVAIETTGLPDKANEQTPLPPQVETGLAAPAAPAQAEPEKKKRGFWSKVFGKREKDSEPERKPQP
jgi:hypothetical protein